MLSVKTHSFEFLVKKLHPHINHTHTNKFVWTSNFLQCTCIQVLQIQIFLFIKLKIIYFCSKVWHGCGIIHNSSKTNNIFTRLIYTHDLIAHTHDHSSDLNKPTHLNESSSPLSPQPVGTGPWGSRPRANAEHALSCGLTSKCWWCSCTWNMCTSQVQIKHNTSE